MSAMRTLLSLNFHFSVWLSIVGGLLVFNYPDFLVPDPESLFGPLRNNLLFAALFLSLIQLILWFARYSRGSAPEALLVGLLFLLVGGGLSYYGKVNGIPINDTCSLIAFYIGASHCLFFWVQSDSLEN
jgi:hypothetical protein